MGSQTQKRSMGDRIRGAVGGMSMKKNSTSSDRNIEPVARSFSTLGHEPQLSSYIVKTVFNQSQGVSFSDLARALLDAKDRYKDKNFKSQLPSLLLRLYFYEYMPSDVIGRLVPCLEVCGKSVPVTRGLLYLAHVHVSRGHAGTPTLLEHSATTFSPDQSTLGAIVEMCQKMINDGSVSQSVKRYMLYVIAAAVRQDEKVGAFLNETMAQMITNVDSKPRKKGSDNQPASATDWDLQHSVFGALRLSGLPARQNDIANACFLGLGSPDAVGARHALAIAEEIALKDPGIVLQEISPLMESVISIYGSTGPSDCVPPACGVNLKDQFARAHLARICARIIHSDQGSLDISRNGAPFGEMLRLFISRDPSDTVRFAALSALTGSIVSPNEHTLGPHSLGNSRDEAVIQQRRARAWRILVAQASMEVSVPGVSEEKMHQLKFMDVIGRIILLALNKPVQAARFTVAASIAAGFAKSCLASQVAGSSSRHASSPEADKVMAILAKELSGLIESPLSGGQRAACIEALLYMQAAGFPVSLSATSFTLVGGEGGAGGGSQDSLLAAVLRCARASPSQAPLFLEYASGIVGIAPAAVDLSKVTALWNAACENGKSSAGKNAALVAALAALRSPLPPSVLSKSGASYQQTLRAAKSDAGWTAFVATAAWWLGEHANDLCEEYVGKPVKAMVLKGSHLNDNRDVDSDVDEDEMEDTPKKNDLKRIDLSKLLDLHAGRVPALSIIISTLHDVILSGTWQLRAAAGRAIGKIAIRSGEPYRLQCYGILVSISTGSQGQDPLGLRGVTAPSLAALDYLYGSQAVIERLWLEYGDKPEEWPEEIVDSVSRRAKSLHDLVEKTVCAVPKAKFAILGAKSVAILSHVEEDGPAYASFLESNAVEKTGDSSNPITSKNKEIEDILSFGGSDDSYLNFTQKHDANTRVDLESLLEKKETASAPWDMSNEKMEGHKSINERKDSLNQINAFAESPLSNRENNTDLSPISNGRNSLRTSLDNAIIGHGVMAHTFIADPNNPEELSIFEGDAVDIVDVLGEGWMVVRDPSGHQGLVPKSYVEILNMTGASDKLKSEMSSDPWGSMLTETVDMSSPAHDASTTRDFFLNRQATSMGGVPTGESWGPAPEPDVSIESPSKVDHIPERQNSFSNPFVGHRRQLSGSSRHGRTFSGASDLYGSLPGSPSRGPEKTVVVGFQGEMEGELSVQPGDKVKVLSDIGGWTKVFRPSDGKAGLIPDWAIQS